MKYTAHQHGKHNVKVETKDRVICDCISDLATAEMIATALNAVEAIAAVLPDLEHYARTHGTGPDIRLAALKSALAIV